jgi:hypothetical protein
MYKLEYTSIVYRIVDEKGNICSLGETGVFLDLADAKKYINKHAITVRLCPKTIDWKEYEKI